MRALRSDPGKTCAPFIWNACRFAENENQVDGNQMTATKIGPYTLKIVVFGNSCQRTHTSTKPLQPLPSPAAMRAGNDVFPNPPHPPSIPSTAYPRHPSSAAWPTGHIIPTTSCLQTHVKIMARPTTFCGHM